MSKSCKQIETYTNINNNFDRQSSIIFWSRPVNIWITHNKDVIMYITLANNVYLCFIMDIVYYLLHVMHRVTSQQSIVCWIVWDRLTNGQEHYNYKLRKITTIGCVIVSFWWIKLWWYISTCIFSALMLSSCLTNSLGRKHELLGCIVFINSICIARTSMLLFKLFKQIKTRIHMIHGYFL